MSIDALTVTNLQKTYDSGTQAVDDISFAIPAGEFFGLVGPNGAGKTTTIHCITGIARPSSGTLTVFGADVVADYRTARTRVGLSPQEYNVDIFATPRHILDWMGGFYGMPRADRAQRIEALLTRFELTQHADKQFRALSGGLKRRVMLARALVHDPDLLILDEPTSGVDVELRHELWRFLRELNEEGKTILLTSHYIEEVELLCSRVGIMSGGRIAEIGKTADLREGRRNLEERYLEITKAAR